MRQDERRLFFPFLYQPLASARLIGKTPPMMSSFTIEFIGMVAATLTTACWIPQAMRTIRTKNTGGISLISQLLLVAGIGLWLVYGLAIGSWPLIIANAITFLMVSIVLALKIRYG